MKLNKCFTDVFNTPLKEWGFKKTGLLYYRMQGVMLQGIWLKTINPFFIHFSTFPYWLYHKRNIYMNMKIKKGWWTQSGGIMAGFYYDLNEPERNKKYMIETFDIFRDTVLPFFDSMKNENDYIHFLVNQTPSDRDLMLKYKQVPSSPEGGWVHAGEIFTPEIFLYHQYFNSPSKPVLEELEEYYDRCMESARQENLSEAIIASKLKNLQIGKDCFLGKIRETSEEDFLNCYNNMCAEMKQLLKDELNLDLDV